ncbi:MAG: hypothetical protein FJ308_14015 [Planctomycetes bacterium]|nr:hypothetical protein [Planctomycetota bacterium]
MIRTESERPLVLSSQNQSSRLKSMSSNQSSGGCYRSVRAYSVLELMIALSLMSALLLLGWSLMASLQDSEQRSWKLTQRVRVLRTTRAWLADDMDHLVRTSLPAATTATAGTNGANGAMLGGGATGPSSSFQGDATGFIATIAPSLDPIRFFDRLVSPPEPTIATSGTAESNISLFASEGELAVQEARESLWPEEGIDVEYRLEPIRNTSERSQTALVEAQDIQYELVRREWLTSQSLARVARTPGSNSSLLAPTDTPMAGTPMSERTLSSADLYRGASDTLEEFIPPLKETRLYGMVQAEFQYFDGNAWSSEWSSGERGGVPLAIAITFDFPRRADFKAPERPSPSDSESDESLDKTFDEDLSGAVDTMQTSVLNPDDASQLSSMNERLMDSSEREYVIIVETGNRVPPPPKPQSAGGFSP